MKYPQPESIADFKARLSAMLRHTHADEPKPPIYRPKGAPSGFYPAPNMNPDPTKPLSEVQS